MRNAKTCRGFILCLLSLLLSVSLFGCMDSDCDDPEPENKPTAMFIEVDRGVGWRVVRHRDSRVMYVVGGGTFTLIVNPDGTPMLWSD